MTEPVELAERIGALAGQAPISLVRLGGGRNSRAWRVELRDGRRLAAKQYTPPAEGGRDRLENEWGALSFLSANGISQVPRPLFLDRPNRLALYSFIEGEAPARHQGRQEDLEPLLDFLAALRRLHSAPGADLLLPAAEACLQPGDLPGQLARRLAALKEVPAVMESGRDLRRFLENRFEPAWAAVRLSAAAGEPPKPLARELAVLSPSDFGFHNAVRAPGGELHLLDFEHFGWDDPVKLALDTALHPHEAMGLSREQRSFFGARMAEIHRDDVDFKKRLTYYRPLIVLKWALILLNEFRTSDLERRAFAGWASSEDIVKGQLLKADKMLMNLETDPI